MNNFENLAKQFMSSMLANPVINEISAENDIELYEILAKKAITAAHVFNKEMKAATLDAEDAEYEIIDE